MALIYLNAAFTVWMLVDAIRHRVEMYWYFIVVFLPFGAWIYFFAVKLRRESFRPVDQRAKKRSVAEIQQRAEETPSVENQIEWGKALFDAQRFQEAQEVFSALLERDPGEKEALYGAALCDINLARTAQGIDRLTQLIELEPEFSDYEPWFDLAFARWQADEPEESIRLLRRLVTVAPRLKHQSILGKYLARASKIDEAREVLNQVLSDYREASGFVKRTNKTWAKEAQRTLDSLPKKQEQTGSP